MNNIQVLQTNTQELQEAISRTLQHELESIKGFSKPANTDELLTRKEASEFLKINLSTLHHWTKKSKIKSYGIANRRYYKKSELLESLTVVK